MDESTSNNDMDTLIMDEEADFTSDSLDSPGEARALTPVYYQIFPPVPENPDISEAHTNQSHSNGSTSKPATSDNLETTMDNLCVKVSNCKLSESHSLKSAKEMAKIIVDDIIHAVEETHSLLKLNTTPNVSNNNHTEFDGTKDNSIETFNNSIVPIPILISDEEICINLLHDERTQNVITKGLYDTYNFDATCLSPTMVEKSHNSAERLTMSPQNETLRFNSSDCVEQCNITSTTLRCQELCDNEQESLGASPNNLISGCTNFLNKPSFNANNTNEENFINNQLSERNNKQQNISISDEPIVVKTSISEYTQKYEQVRATLLDSVVLEAVNELNQDVVDVNSSVTKVNNTLNSSSNNKSLKVLYQCLEELHDSYTAATESASSASTVAPVHNGDLQVSVVKQESEIVIEERSPLKMLDRNTHETNGKKEEDPVIMPDIKNKENHNVNSNAPSTYDLSIFSDTPTKPKPSHRRDSVLRLFDPLYESSPEVSLQTIPVPSLRSQSSCVSTIINEEPTEPESTVLAVIEHIKGELSDERDLGTFINTLPGRIQQFKSNMDDAIEDKMKMEQELNKVKLELNQLQQELAALKLELHQKDEVILKTQGEAHKKGSQYKLEIKQLHEKLNTVNEQNNNEEVKHLSDEIASLKEREAQLNEKLNKCAEKVSSFKSILDGYETTLSRIIPESEKLKVEHDTAKKHLASIEMSFNDVHTKYERCKDIIAGYKNNEETLMESLDKSNQVARKYEERYEALKAHAKAQLDKANKELSAMRDKHHIEMSKMTALIKRLEIKNGSIQQALEQKTKECAALAALCDEMAGSVPH